MPIDLARGGRMLQTFDFGSAQGRRFRRRTIGLLAAGAGLVAFQPGAAFGQEDDPPARGALAALTDPVGPSMTVTGFRGLEWGMAETDILRTYGEPFERRELESGLRMMAYHSILGGQPSVVLFGLLDEGGLVKAQEVIDVAGGDACIEIVRDIHHAIDLQYPLIRPREQARNNTPDTICEAAPRGQAYWHRQWTDAETGSVITVSLASGSEHVDLIYESRRFREWVDPAADGTFEVLEDEGASTEVLEAAP